MIRSEERYTQYPGDNGTRYYKYIPSGGVAPIGVILFLHGKGEIGTNIAQVEHNELPKALAVEGVRAGLELPYIVIAPQEEPGQEWWGRALTAVEIAQSMGLGKPHFTGLSLGAMAIDNILHSMGDVFASVAPVAGGYEDELKAGTFELLKSIPTRHYYGTDDEVIDYGYSSTKKIVNALKNAGADATFVEYAGRGHNIWPEAYADYAQWLEEKFGTGGEPVPVQDDVVENWVEGTNIFFKSKSGVTLVVAGTTVI